MIDRDDVEIQMTDRSRNVELLWQWESHVSRVFYAFRDADARRPREELLINRLPDRPPEGPRYPEHGAYGQQFAVVGVRQRPKERGIPNVDTFTKQRLYRDSRDGFVSLS